MAAAHRLPRTRPELAAHTPEGSAPQRLPRTGRDIRQGTHHSLLVVPILSNISFVLDKKATFLSNTVGLLNQKHYLCKHINQRNDEENNIKPTQGTRRAVGAKRTLPHARTML